MKVLVTGAAGYIGSHVSQALIEECAQLSLVFLDDLSTGHREFVDRLAELAKKMGQAEPKFYQVDLLDAKRVAEIFQIEKPEAVFHFAAKISVAESVQRPDFYFSNNLEGSKNLLAAMRAVQCKKMIFSSTAAVYGKVSDPLIAKTPLTEATPLAPINPYGETKLKMEQEIRAASKEWGLSSVIFRYFNAAGASADSSFGEWHEPETHLIPLLLRAGIRGEVLKVYGTDYETRDGSCVRDYIHVSDLASAHLLGMKLLNSSTDVTAQTFNLGTANGVSVLEMVRAAERVLGKKVKIEVHSRREGDSDTLIADSSRARSVLGWSPKHSQIENILDTALRWERELSSH